MFKIQFQVALCNRVRSPFGFKWQGKCALYYIVLVQAVWEEIKGKEQSSPPGWVSNRKEKNIKTVR